MNIEFSHQQSHILPEKKKNLFNTAFFVCLALLFVSVVLWCISAVNVKYAEWIATYISGALRFLLAKATAAIPLSAAEVLIPFAILSFFLYFSIHTVCLLRFRKAALTGFFRFWRNIFCVAAVLLSFSVTGYLVCYKRKPLAENLSLTRREIDLEELAETMISLRYELDEMADNITFSPGGDSVMPYSFAEMNRLLNESYRDLAQKYPFLSSFSSPVKLIALSPVMTYTHLSGIYVPMTGEANININYPDYIIAYTAAHEMAHQRGIAPEDEANFMAYLVCMNSNDPYLQYSGTMSLFDAFGDALFLADRDRYYEIVGECDSRIIGEIRSFSTFFQKFLHSKASKVTDTINDSYLKSQGQKSGVQSYGMVVDLAVAYFDKTKGR